jgi:hypothetical protein
LTAAPDTRPATNGLTARTWADYKVVTDRLSVVFGLTRLVDDLAAAEFEWLRAEAAKTLGPVALGNYVQRVRSTFKYAFDAELIDKPIRYGPSSPGPVAGCRARPATLTAFARSRRLSSAGSSTPLACRSGR